jgi:hypothetical protein
MKIIPIMKSEKATTFRCTYDRNKTFVDRGPGHESLQSVFDADHLLFWNNLSRLNNLLVVMNISMFFLTGLVAKGYFYTFSPWPVWGLWPWVRSFQPHGPEGSGITPYI